MQNNTPRDQRHTWLLIVEKIDFPQISGESSQFPHALLIHNLTKDTVLNIEVAIGEPSADSMLEFLKQTIQKEIPPTAGERSAPTMSIELCVADETLYDRLSDPLDVLEIPLYYTPNEPAAKLFQKKLPNHVFRSSLPGILSGEGVTEELAGNFFQAAARFYKAAPWTYLPMLEPLSVRILPQPERFVCFQGMKGALPGLMLFREWENLKTTLLEISVKKKECDSPARYQTCYFSYAGVAPLADVQAAEEHSWELAGERAFPFPASLMDDDFFRPNRNQLLWYQAALPALTEFVSSLERDPEGEFLPAQSVLVVQTSTGEQKVEIAYPGGELDLASLPLTQYQDDRIDYRDFLYTKPEGQPGELLPGSENDPAQALIHQAHQETSRASRIMLAYQALSLSPQCADAYIILAEDDAGTFGKALRYYRQAVQLTEPKLKGKGPLDLGEIEDRYAVIIHPYLTAKQGLAYTLTVLRELAEAVRHYQEILKLVPEDPLYVRGKLLSLLLDLDRVKEADQLLDEYKNPHNPDWQYTRALRQYQQEGNSRRARRELRGALESNPFVAEQLISPVFDEEEELESYVLADMQDRAHSYRNKFRHLWQRTPGALSWLEDQTRHEDK